MLRHNYSAIRVIWESPPCVAEMKNERENDARADILESCLRPMSGNAVADRAHGLVM
jgi:hypothetical protein